MSERPMARVRRAFEKRQARTEAWVQARELVGLSFAEVVTAAQADDIFVRALSENGRGFWLTADRSADRVNVDVVDGRISKVHGVY